MMLQDTSNKIRTSVRLQTPKRKRSDVDKSTGLSPKNNAKGIKAKLHGKMKLTSYKWKNDEIIALIKAVEKRPILWMEDFHGSGNSAKNLVWVEILSELRIEGIDESKLKKKWSTIRSVQNAYHRKNKPTKWDDYLSFLPLAASTNEKSPEVEVSSLDGLSTAPREHDNLELSMGSKKGCMQIGLTPTRVSSSTQCVRSPPRSSEAAALQSSDPNSTFCAYLSAELCMLSEVDSSCARRLIIQQLYDFLETTESNSN